jgi:hypothetical protein
MEKQTRSTHPVDCLFSGKTMAGSGTFIPGEVANRY